jgi:hypothetical protein
MPKPTGNNEGKRMLVKLLGALVFSAMLTVVSHAQTPLWTPNISVLNFGNVEQEVPSAGQVVVFTNVSGAVQPEPRFWTDGGRGITGGGYSIPFRSCDNVAPSGTCNVTIFATPSIRAPLGAFNYRLGTEQTLLAASSLTLNMNVTSTLRPFAEMEDAPGQGSSILTVPVGSSVTRNIRITNLGAGTLAISAINLDSVSISNPVIQGAISIVEPNNCRTANLANGQSCVFSFKVAPTVAFRPLIFGIEATHNGQSRRTVSISYIVTAPNACSLDIDGSGGVPDAITDGVLLSRYALGFRGPGLIYGLSLSGVRTTAEAIESYMFNRFYAFFSDPGAPPKFDESLIAIRLMRGTPDSALLTGVRATSYTAAQMRARVNSACGTSF